MRINYPTKIEAFTLTEFAVAMTIITLISGLMLASLFFVNKWTYNYQTITTKYEDIFECATLFKTDFYLSKKIEVNGNKLILVNMNNDTIIYRRAPQFLIREFNNFIFDTINVKNHIEIDNGKEGKKSKGIKLTLIIDTDSLNVVCRVPYETIINYN